MNPSEMRPIPPPIVGYCRATGKPLTAEEAVYVDGFLYSREYAEKMKQQASPYAAGAVPPPVNNEISPGWAFVLGLIPGVGAIYNQQYAKGLIHIVVFAFLITALEKSNAEAFFVPLLIGWLFYMPFEAYHTARKRQLNQPVAEFSGVMDLPEAWQKLPIGPVLLILFGLIFLLDNLGLLYLDQIVRFWPVLLIAVGVGMLLRRTQNIANAENIGNKVAEDSRAD
ncbi:MAG: hypothetical protein OHK0021_09770 [Bryobacter sp.]